MPTLAQMLQVQQKPANFAGRVVTVSSATTTLITTAFGDMPNATGGTPAAGDSVVTLQIGNQEFAIGWLHS